MPSFKKWRLAVSLAVVCALATNALATPGDGLQRWRERIKHNPIVASLIALLDPPPENKISLPPA